MNEPNPPLTPGELADAFAGLPSDYLYAIAEKLAPQIWPMIRATALNDAKQHVNMRFLVNGVEVTKDITNTTVGLTGGKGQFDIVDFSVGQAAIHTGDARRLDVYAVGAAEFPYDYLVDAAWAHTVSIGLGTEGQVISDFSGNSFKIYSRLGPGGTNPACAWDDARIAGYDASIFVHDSIHSGAPENLGGLDFSCSTANQTITILAAGGPGGMDRAVNLNQEQHFTGSVFINSSTHTQAHTPNVVIQNIGFDLNALPFFDGQTSGVAMDTGTEIKLENCWFGPHTASALFKLASGGPAVRANGCVGFFTNLFVRNLTTAADVGMLGNGVGVIGKANAKFTDCSFKLTDAIVAQGTGRGKFLVDMEFIGGEIQWAGTPASTFFSAGQDTNPHAVVFVGTRFQGAGTNPSFATAATVVDYNSGTPANDTAAPQRYEGCYFQGTTKPFNMLGNATNNPKGLQITGCTFDGGIGAAPAGPAVTVSNWTNSKIGPNTYIGWVTPYSLDAGINYEELSVVSGTPAAPNTGKFLTYAADATNLPQSEVWTPGSGLQGSGTPGGAYNALLGNLTADWNQTGAFNINHGAHMALGSGAASTTTSILTASETLDTALGPLTAVSGLLTANLTADTGNQQSGLGYTVLVSGAHNLTGTPGIVVIQAAAKVSGATVTDLRHSHAQLANAPFTGTVTNRYGYYFADATGAGLTLANQYGFYVPALTKGGTVNWAFYSVSANSAFGGSVAVGHTTTPVATACLDSSPVTTKGWLAPNLTTTQRNAITTPATGLLIFNVTTNQYEFWNGSAWAAIGTSGLTSPLTTKGDLWTFSTVNARLAVGTDGQKLVSRSSATTGNAWEADTRAISFTMDGGGSTLTTGVRPSFQIPYACTIQRWSIQGDAAGTCTIDVTTATDAATPSYASIVGAGTKPNVAGPAIGTVSTAPASWTSTSIAARTLMQFNLSAVATFKWLTITLEVTVS